MEAASAFIGVNVHCGGKVIGRITALMIDFKKKEIGGLACVSTNGLFRRRFFVKKEYILHLDRHGAVVEKHPFTEEYGRIGAAKEADFVFGSVGEAYFDPATLKLQSVSIKRGLLDDLLYGRDIVDANNVSLSDQGVVIINRE